VIPHQEEKPATEAAGFLLAPYFMPPSSPLPMNLTHLAF
jgi:hypothetical protein